MTTKSKQKPKTVSEKVTDLLLRRDGEESSDESSDEEAPRVVDFDEDEYAKLDARSSDFRKRNVKLLSEQSAKYRGKITSRKDFESDDDDDDDEVDEDVSYEESDDNDDDDDNDDGEQEDSEDDDEEEEAFKAFSKKLTNGTPKSVSKRMKDMELEEDNDEDASDDEGSSNEDDEDDFDDDDDDDDDEEAESENNDTPNIVTETNRHAEIQKGESVQNQLRIWEKLLELRIQTQKLVTKSNQLPEPQALQQQIEENDEMRDLSQEATQKTATLLKSLLDLRYALSSQYSELKNSMKTSLKRPAPFNPSEMPPPTKRIGEDLQTHFNEFKTYRNSVLLKWDDRTKLLTPGAGAKKKSMYEEYDIIRKIDNALMNRHAMIEKSQTMKLANNAAAEVANKSKEADEDDAANQVNNANVNVYDDSDFYHHQLRELIEYKANTSASMAEVTKQYVELQKLRQKMKKKVDTRASKGRKIRYTVHNKLVNFMAPNETADSWTDESKDELYRSLFA